MPARRVGALQCLGCLVTKARPGLRNAGQWKGEGRNVFTPWTHLSVVPKPSLGLPGSSPPWALEGRQYGWLVGPFQGPGVPTAPCAPLLPGLYL